MSEVLNEIRTELSKLQSRLDKMENEQTAKCEPALCAPIGPPSLGEEPSFESVYPSYTPESLCAKVKHPGKFRKMVSPEKLVWVGGHTLYMYEGVIDSMAENWRFALDPIPPAPEGYYHLDPPEWREPKVGEWIMFGLKACRVYVDPPLKITPPSRFWIIHPITPPKPKLRKWILTETGEKRQIQYGEFFIGGAGEPRRRIEPRMGSWPVLALTEVKGDD